MGGRSRAVPPTRGTLIERLRDPATAPAAYEALVAAYWKPVYAQLRRRLGLGNEDAKDLTQAFFTHVVERGSLARYDRERARFRTWLSRLLESFAANEHARSQAQKRGGGTTHVSIDPEDVDQRLGASAPVAADEVVESFEREWQRALFEDALEAFRARCMELGKPQRFDLLMRADVTEVPQDESRPSYRTLAAEFGLEVTQVTNELHAARRELRECVLDALRARCVDEDDFAHERRALEGLHREIER